MYEVQYPELLSQHGIAVEGLPQDIKQKIQKLKSVENALKMVEKQGRKPSEATLEKIKNMDAEICSAITEVVASSPPPKKKNDDQDGDNYAYGDDATGRVIDSELSAAFTNGKTSITFEELKTISKTAHDIIFNSYDANGENGIITSHFKLIEIDEYVFKLEKI